MSDRPTDTGVKVRYVIAYHPPRTAVMVGLNDSRLFEAGWYRTIYDEQGREAFVSGPHKTADECLAVEPDATLPSAVACLREIALNGSYGARGMMLARDWLRKHGLQNTA